MANHRKRTPEIEIEIMRLYNLGYGTVTIGKKLSISTSTVKTSLKSNGMKIRSLEEYWIKKKGSKKNQETPICSP